MRCMYGAIRAIGIAAALAASMLAAAPGARAQTPPDSKECLDCHAKQTDKRLSAPAHSYPEDIHAKRGLGCVSCHGSEAEQHQEHPNDGTFRKPRRKDIPALCGRCHSDGEYMRQFNPGLRTDQVKEYWTSVHGKRLRADNDTSVAVCVSCHPAHNILPPTDPASSVFPRNVTATCGRCHSDKARMARYGIPTDQADKYLRSVHSEKLLNEGDLSAPVCNDCHGNHGATPPGVSSVLNVCGQCHSVIEDNFNKSEHAEIFADDELPGCVTCHGNHEITKPTTQTLRERYEQVCSECHPEGDPSGLSFLKIADVLDSLTTAVGRSRRILEDARNKGMEVSQALFDLDGVTNAETEARNAIHTLHLDPVVKAADPGFKIAARTLERGERALVEHRFRRIGLGISAAIIVLLITSLFFKIRDMETRASAAENAVDEYFRRVMGRSLSPGSEAARIAASALLLEAAYTDDRLSEADRKFVDGVVRSRFGLAPAEAEGLIELLRRERSYAGRLTRFATLISERLSAEHLDVVLEELWRLVLADETLAAHEVSIMEDVAMLLHVERDVVAAACRRVTAAASGGMGTGTMEDR